jgi:hypothetical protein
MGSKGGLCTPIPWTRIVNYLEQKPDFINIENLPEDNDYLRTGLILATAQMAQ